MIKISIFLYKKVERKKVGKKKDRKRMVMESVK
jgi:hypothetical protein